MTDRSLLEELGWSDRWRALFAPHEEAGLVPARVVRADRGSCLAASAEAVFRAKPSTRLLKSIEGPAELPAVGDWVAVRSDALMETPLVEAVLERGSAITRGDPGSRSELQVLAANIDTVFVVQPVADGPNLRRIERELSLAWESGAVPVVVLTKADLAPDPEGARAAVEAVAIGVDVLLVNALDPASAERLLDHVSGGRTAVLIGPSGAGKSTLTNALLGEERQATQEVRLSDGRGRHTTVARELIRIGGRGILIDTPGLRALGLTGSEEGIGATFPEIEELAGDCRFRDCTHADEPGCAVAAAVETGALPAERLASYHKLIREAQVVAMKTDARLRAEEQRKWKLIAKSVRELYRRKGRG